LPSIGLDPRWYYAARVCTVALLLWILRAHYTEMHGISGITGPRIAVAVGAGIAVFLLWINLDFGWARFGNSTPFDPTQPDGAGIDWNVVFFRLSGLALVVPVMEELFWRSYLLRRLDRLAFLTLDPAKSGVRAMLICASLFASEHSLWFAGLLAGLVYGLVYVRGGNLWLPIISHATTNAALGGWVLATGHWEFW
jgi:CAAX prenyl protease-like protein